MQPLASICTFDGFLRGARHARTAAGLIVCAVTDPVLFSNKFEFEKGSRAHRSTLRFQPPGPWLEFLRKPHENHSIVLPSRFLPLPLFFLSLALL